MRQARTTPSKTIRPVRRRRRRRHAFVLRSGLCRSPASDSLVVVSRALVPLALFRPRCQLAVSRSYSFRRACQAPSLEPSPELRRVVSRVVVFPRVEGFSFFFGFSEVKFRNRCFKPEVRVRELGVGFVFFFVGMTPCVSANL